MKFQYSRGQISLALAVILILTSTASSTEVQNDLPPNHKDAISTPSPPRLKMEPRGDDEGIDLNAIESKSKSSSLIFADEENPDKPPLISGSTSRVAIVYSERNPAETNKIIKPSKSPIEERNRRKSVDIIDKIVKPKKSSDERFNWRVVKSSSSDSYLDALDHSHTSKDPREGVVAVDTKPKMSKLIRRDYNDGPVYRPSDDQSYGISKEPGSTYGSPGSDNYAPASNNFARISYGGPTPEPFLPTPSDSYSLPIHSTVNFNNNRGSYGAPQPQTSYGVPSNRYGPSLPQSSYGPPTNGYPASGGPQQAYGPPSPVYGAPYAIQDYSQLLPSLPSIGFSWPIALKLNAFTIAKILLKLVIFKMIVKFIAVICLLLFIPKLEIIKKGDKDDADDDDGRRLLASDSALERLNILTALVTSSIEKYEKETGKSISSDEECTSFGCRARKFVTFDQSWNDYVALFKSYVAEETNNDEDAGTLTNHVDS